MVAVFRIQSANKTGFVDWDLLQDVLRYEDRGDVRSAAIACLFLETKQYQTLCRCSRATLSSEMTGKARKCVYDLLVGLLSTVTLGSRDEYGVRVILVFHRPFES